MTLNERYTHILSYFRESQPTVTTELEFGSIFQLLVAVVLSAQCTDKRVNQVTPALFRRYPSAKEMSRTRSAANLASAKEMIWFFTKLQ